MAAALGLHGSTGRNGERAAGCRRARAAQASTRSAPPASSRVPLQATWTVARPAMVREMTESGGGTDKGESRGDSRDSRQPGWRWRRRARDRPHPPPTPFQQATRPAAWSAPPPASLAPLGSTSTAQTASSASRPAAATALAMGPAAWSALAPRSPMPLASAPLTQTPAAAPSTAPTAPACTGELPRLLLLTQRQRQRWWPARLASPPVRP